VLVFGSILLKFSEPLLVKTVLPYTGRKPYNTPASARSWPRILAPSEQLAKTPGFGPLSENRNALPKERPAKVCYDVLAVATNVSVCVCVWVSVCVGRLLLPPSEPSMVASCRQSCHHRPRVLSCQLVTPLGPKRSPGPSCFLVTPVLWAFVAGPGRAFSSDFGRLQSLSVAFWSRCSLVRQLPKIKPFLWMNFASELSEWMNEQGVERVYGVI